MKGYIYILLNKKNNYYIGSTNNLKRRLNQHYTGKVVSIRAYLPLKCVLSQEYNDLKIARRIELKLKKLKRRDYIDKIITQREIKMAA